MMFAADVRPLWREAARRVLVAAGQPALAKLLDGATLEILPDHESWEMGDRRVAGVRLALVLEAPEFVALRERAGGLDAVRDAVAAAVRSPETELAELLALVALPPSVERGSAYRSAPRWDPPPPDPNAVLAAAVALARAYTDERGARLLAGAQLERASVGELGEGLVRWLVRVSPESFVELDGDAGLCERVQRMVRVAAQSPRERVADVELGLLLGP